MINYWKPFEIDEANKRIVLGNMVLPIGSWLYAAGPMPPDHILIPPSADLFAPVDGFAVVDSDGIDEGVYPDSITRTVLERIDANPSTTFYVVTRWPERVKETFRCKEWNSEVYNIRKNVILTLQINSQSDLAKVPDLLKLKDLCGGLALRIEPEERIGPELEGIEMVFLSGGNEEGIAYLIGWCSAANIPVYVESDDVQDNLKVRELGVRQKNFTSKM